jgi:hypothetical protein
MVASIASITQSFDGLEDWLLMNNTDNTQLWMSLFCKDINKLECFAFDFETK